MRRRLFLSLLLSVCLLASASTVAWWTRAYRQRPAGTQFLTWPAHDNGRDHECRELVSARFKTASATPLGAAGDDATIRKLVIADALTRHGDGTVTIQEMGWLSADEVLVHAYWSAPYAGAHDDYVLQRRGGKWVPVRCYGGFAFIA